ncbi:DUF397 domain-containing protein [Streptomyces sp. NPDC049813]|uniref:DUF397 domain-containing protein n=1 Tax=Streptomyces sp. NPDC049813 TaxID=3365597 RepID=UPI0037AE7669
MGRNHRIPAATQWRKSSYSGTNGGDCVEVAALWRKSSYSGTNGGECVEVAALPAAVAVRDSKNLDAGPFRVTPAAFTAFVTAASLGRV